jgi:hypothetical protein
MDLEVAGGAAIRGPGSTPVALTANRETRVGVAAAIAHAETAEPAWARPVFHVTWRRVPRAADAPRAGIGPAGRRRVTTAAESLL